MFISAIVCPNVQELIENENVIASLFAKIV
jgi:hypothetical protein